VQYAVERYLPGVTAEQYDELQARIASAARRLASEGVAIRYLGSTFIPGEDSCFCRYESENVDAVRRACELAAVPFARISEAREFESASAGYRAPLAGADERPAPTERDRS
jgi:hypothetical protein